MLIENKTKEDNIMRRIKIGCYFGLFTGTRGVPSAWRLIYVVVFFMAAITAGPFTAYGTNMLEVTDANSNTQFLVTDTGLVGIGTASPLYQLHVSSNGTPPTRGIVSSYHCDSVQAAAFQLQKSRGSETAPLTVQNGDFLGAIHADVYDGTTYLTTASIMFNSNGTVAVGSVPTDIVFMTGSSNSSRLEKMRLTSAGNLGIGTPTPTNPIQLASGAYVTTGGTWTNASSREYKENIAELSATAANKTLKGLNPVLYNYKVDKEERHVGFIAEDVPDLVATKDRKGLSSMDIVAVLTKVAQEQQQAIETLEAIVANLAAEINSLKSKDFTAQR
jgi:hypothetical protein